MRRRDFLRQTTTAFAGVAVASQRFCFSAPEDAIRPDILLIMPDQMRGDCLSILDHPVVRTPQLDRLAREGVLFRRAYTGVASCIPARYELLTGLYPQTSGVVGFKAKPISTLSMPGALTAAGYATVLVGRYMHQLPESGACGYQREILGSTHVENDEYHRFLQKAAPEVKGIRAFVEEMGLTYNHWQAKPWPLADNLHPTEWIVARSCDVVRETAPGQALFLTTSFYAPHPPLFPPKRYFDALYANKHLPPSAHGDWVDWKALSPEGDKAGHRVLLEGEVLRTAQAGYYGLIEHLDNQIASLIRDFKARSEKAKRPWVIVFTSDHGEMMGDHGYFRKCEPFEGSANIPFIIASSPELGFKPGLRVMQPVCLADTMPTLLGLAGVTIPEDVDGVNLAPTLRGREQRIREWLHFEHAPCYSEAQAYHALTDGHYKYIWRPADGREHLFNLDEDPREERDLSKVPSHHTTLEKWRTRLVHRLAGRPEGFVAEDKLVPGRPYKPLNEGTLSR
ncbi:MAG TPA: sulfatase-like hydrolase/transferase [Candidatus Bathyarchaeia archaeon]|nr:sulfatase-like hydrolase/transferase [Candidatus Bathyarchaeia archaeon]